MSIFNLKAKPKYRPKDLTPEESIRKGIVQIKQYHLMQSYRDAVAWKRARDKQSRRSRRVNHGK